MLICLDRRRLRYVLFALLAVSINLIDSAVIRSAVDARQRLVFSRIAFAADDIQLYPILTKLY